MTTGTSSRLATVLDIEMLRANGTSVYPAGTPLSVMTLVANLADQLGGRYLLRYLRAVQVGTLLGGTSKPQYVTPTPYTPAETISWLALPFPLEVRSHVILLDPSQLSDVYGPRLVQLGGGIEYVLAQGFPASAIVNVSPGGPSPWEIEVR